MLKKKDAVLGTRVRLVNNSADARMNTCETYADAGLSNGQLGIVDVEGVDYEGDVRVRWDDWKHPEGYRALQNSLWMQRSTLELVDE